MTGIGKHFAVVAPGPGVECFDAEQDGVYDGVVAVNRAVEIVEAGFWACLDAHTPAICERILGKPKLICSRQTFHQILGRWPDVAMAGLAADHREMIVPGLTAGNNAWRALSATVAVAFAAARGATVIDCYGFAWRGEGDWDGRRDSSQSRTPERWAKERRTFEMLSVELSAAGVMVARVSPQPEPARGREENR